jgi:hypothetical protein
MIYEQESIVDQCIGCPKITTMIWWKTGAPVKVCSVYIKPRVFWNRGGCMFNMNTAATPKARKRVGQQKQRK